jgi:hypothetical protein
MRIEELIGGIKECFAHPQILQLALKKLRIKKYTSSAAK